MFKDAYREKIADYLKAHPEIPYTAVGTLIGVLAQTIWLIAKEYGIKRKRGRKIVLSADILKMLE
jgi:hypothetical protein